MNYRGGTAYVPGSAMSGEPPFTAANVIVPALPGATGCRKNVHVSELNAAPAMIGRMLQLTPDRSAKLIGLENLTRTASAPGRVTATTLGRI
jgi:hypothetical protein